MDKRCFTCGCWKADVYKISIGKCYLFPDNPKVRTANEHCIFWRAIKIDPDKLGE